MNFSTIKNFIYLFIKSLCFPFLNICSDILALCFTEIKDISLNVEMSSYLDYY